METWATYGYWGLFFAAFIAGSILPFSAELLIGILLYQGFPLIPLVLVATLGNWLGGYTAFFMGYYARWDLILKYFSYVLALLRLLRALPRQQIIRYPVARSMSKV